jgi:hypothetical protein
VLPGPPQLTPAPFSSHGVGNHQHFHQGFSLNDDAKYYSGNQYSGLTYPYRDYDSFHPATATGGNGAFYSGRQDHSPKLNLQARNS